jgi:E1A/CREB-binding protein
MSRFQLCGDCFGAAKEAAAVPAGGGASHPKALPAGMAISELIEEHVAAIPRTHDDGNADVESEFFDTRQAFLSLCQGNHYQFDTMRRAKHSSMMVLYHLHNPQAPAFACTCNSCGQEVEPGSGWRCTKCTDFDLCGPCAQRIQHPHRLVPNARKIDETRQRISDDERRDRAAQLQRTMKLVEHASGCRDPHCVSSNCHKIKEMFAHAQSCRIKVMGGCGPCRRMWTLLQLHAKQCNVVDCPVLRCRELRQMRRLQMQRQEDKRRIAYKNMLRNHNGGQGSYAQH